MYRMHMRGDDYACLCTTFALGVMVGFIGNEKIRFLCKMHKKHGNSCCDSNQNTTVKEDPAS